MDNRVLAVIVAIVSIGVFFTPAFPYVCFFSKFTLFSASPIGKGIVFLCTKGVFSDLPQRQNMEFSFLRSPSSAPLSSQKHYRNAQARLLRLITQPEENHTNILPSDVHTFTAQEFPGYNNDDVYFLKYPGKLVQRHQLSGLCYMHAPAVVQHYKLDSTRNNLPMIDLLQIVRDNFTSLELGKHIFNDEGGSSKEFLEYILEPNSVIVVSSIMGSADFFDKYGVGLVSGFQVHADFYNGSVHRHYGKPWGNFIGSHAMALVGHRKDKNGTQFFLLQNWWKSKQFVELDESYLENCGASVYFVKTPQTTIPGNFSKHYGRFFELELIDKPERLPYECTYQAVCN